MNLEYINQVEMETKGKQFENFTNIQISISKLTEVWNPYERNVWEYNGTPITKHEVRKEIDLGNLMSPLQENNWRRIDHIRRVAWFVVNGWSDSIEVDFGCPSFNVNLLVCDGNHRLAASILKKDSFIKANASGEESEIEVYRFTKE